MLNLKSKITIKQRGNAAYPNRSRTFICDFVNNLEINSSWQNLSDTGSIILPRKLYFIDELGNKVNIFGVDIGASLINEVNGIPPLMMRGDSIKIELGYEYETEPNVYKTELNTEFEGFITSIKDKLPLELGFEDNMWLLKQVQAPNKTYKTGKGQAYNLESMLKELINLANKELGTSLSVKVKINGSDIITNIGDFTTQNETIAQVLDRLQKDFRFESNFVGNELRCGYIVYYPEDMDNVAYKFQHNIISDNLIYKRKDDVKIGVESHAFRVEPLKTKNKDGSTKYKTVKVDYFGYFDNKGLNIVPIANKPTQFDGEIRTINMMNMPEDQIKEFIKRQLNRITYEGWRGDFETFGLPFVKHGMICQLIDDILVERNGKYMIKAVTTTFGMGGFRRKIQLDLRIDNITQAEINAGL